MSVFVGSAVVMPTLGDVITALPDDKKGEMVLVVDKKRKNVSYKAYLIGLKSKEKWGELRRHMGKSVTIVFMKEDATPEPLVSDKDATIFLTVAGS